MLNSCIQHKRKHDHSMTDTTCTKGQSKKPKSSLKVAETKSKNVNIQFKEHEASHNIEDSDTDEEFYEAVESQDETPSGSARRNTEEELRREKTEEIDPAPVDSPGSSIDGAHELESESGRSGILKRCGDLVLVATGEPLYIPITQVKRVRSVSSSNNRHRMWLLFLSEK